MVAQFFNVAKDDAGAQIRRELVDSGLDLSAQFVTFHLSLHRRSGRPQVIFVVLKVVRGGVLRRALAFAVIVDH